MQNTPGDLAPRIGIVVAFTVLIAVSLIVGDRGSSASDSRGTAAVAGRVAPIAEAIEEVRGLEFERRPEPVVVTSEEVRREGLADLEREYPAPERRADEEVLKLIGLLEPDDDVGEISSTILGEEVLGFYDPRRERLALVDGAQPDDPVLAEIALAHELVHALEDQRFDLAEPDPGQDDANTATTALIEGTATEAMARYAQANIDPGQALGSALSSGAGGDAAADLPPYVRASLEFSYVNGQSFVRELLRAGGDWRLVDLALDTRPPESTEQIIHPVKYLTDEAPEAVELELEPMLGDGWSRSAEGALGEFDTAQMLANGAAGRAQRAAAGWGGGRYELWQREGVGGEACDTPCRRADALALGWRWDTSADARQFRIAATDHLVKGLDAKPAGSGRWRVEGGAVALSSEPRATAIAFAPSPALAERLASRNARG